MKSTAGSRLASIRPCCLYPSQRKGYGLMNRERVGSAPMGSGARDDDDGGWKKEGALFLSEVPLLPYRCARLDKNTEAGCWNPSL